MTSRAAQLRETLPRLLVALVLSAGVLAAVAAPGKGDGGEGAVAATAASQRLVSLGMQHSCAITDAGAVQCWGDNHNGQLGTGDLLTSTSPRLVGGITGAVELAAGNSHTCALLHGGSVRCWGLNGSGQLGNGSATLADSPDPQTVSGVSGVKHLAAGGFHTCALLTGGTVSCWGQDGSGQLGDNAPGDYASAPQPVSGLPAGDPVVGLVAGESHTCAVTDAGRMWCWGHNAFGELGNNTQASSAVPVPVGKPGDPSEPMVDVLAASAGGGSTCAILDQTGRPAFCWGDNSHGQLGHATPEVDDVMQPSTVPLRVQVDANANPLVVDAQPMIGARSISLGHHHACAVLDGSGVRCWGMGGSGQLGYQAPPIPDEHNQDSTYAMPVPGLSARAVVGGGFHTCALTGGALQCWGHNFFGQLGGNDEQVETPTTVTAVRGAASVALANHAGCALVAEVPGGDAVPYCWGSNANGRLGIGSTAPPETTVRRPVDDFPTSATDLRAGNGTFCAVPDGAGRTCWGLNGSGEIGDGTTTDRLAPVTTTHLAGATAYDLGGTLSAGAERGTTCKVVSGQARCWGYNGQGQLGNGTITDSLSPVTVLFDQDPDPGVVTLVPLTGVTAVAVGGDHACALVGGGQVWCWGANNAGQLGDNTLLARPAAVKVQQDTDDEADAPLGGVTSIVAGNSHSCAVLTSKKVRCWGSNSAGQLGRAGAGQQANLPVKDQLGDLADVTDLVAGDNHNCAIKAAAGAPNDQTLLCWGANNENQLGVSGGNSAVAKITLATPDPDDPLPGPWISDVAASRDNTCAVLLDTTVSCWGDNSDGQVGDGIGSSSMARVTVEGGTTYDTNQIPLPPDLAASTTPGNPVVIPVPLIGVDPDGTPVTLVSVGDPPLGSETHDATSITYTPDPGCHDDSFAYVVSDGIAQVAAQVAVEMNCPPVALPDDATTAEDTHVDIDVLANDSDEDGDTLTLDPTFPVTPGHGAVSIVAGKVRYTPTADFCGPPTDTFTYRVSDGHGHEATAAVVVTVTCAQDGPTASPDNVSTPEDTLLVLDDELLANDGDVDGESLTFTAVGPASHGTTTVSATAIHYQPTTDYCGPDSFTYTVSDGTATATATVTVAVTCIGDSPVAKPDTPTVEEDTSTLVDVLANDTDPDGDALGLPGTLSTPEHGTAVIEAGKVRYTPAADYCGQDSFTYVVSDGALTAVGTVNLTVTCVNDAPVANPDAASTPEDQTVHVHVLTNDVDVDGNPLLVGAIGAPAHGTAVPAPNNAIAYTPAPNFHGTDSFTYEAVDPAGLTSTATVTISVTPVDDPVQLAAITNQATPWGNTLSVPLSASDVDAEPITYSVVSGPAGTETDGSAFSWTPTAAQVGVHAVTVRALSGGANADRTFQVTVEKRATALTYDGPLSGQLSDATPLHATLRDAATTAPVPGRAVGFVLGSSSASGTTDAAGGATGLIQVLGGPGARSLLSSFAGDAAWKSSSAAASFDVTKESMTVTVAPSAPTTTTGTSATATYVADLAEEADGTHAAQMGAVTVTFRRLDGSVMCAAGATGTAPGRGRASCTASQPVGALPVIATATSAAYSSLAAVGVVTVTGTTSGTAAGAGSVEGDAFGFQARPPAKKSNTPIGNAVHVIASGGTAQVVSAASLTSYSSGCSGKTKLCTTALSSTTATVTTVVLSTGDVIPAGSATLSIDATAPDRFAVSVSGSVTRTIGSVDTQALIDAGLISVVG